MQPDAFHGKSTSQTQGFPVPEEGSKDPDLRERAASAPSRRGLTRRRAALISIVVFIVVWHVVSALAGSNGGHEHNVPNLLDIARSFKSLGYYWKGGYGVKATNIGGELTWGGAMLSFVFNSAVTLLRMIAGLALGTLTGVGLAAAISWSRTLRRMVLFPAHVARMLPLLALVTLFALWFGETEVSAVLFVGFATAVVMFALTLNAITNTPPFYEQSARSLGASRLRIYLSVVLPSTLPQLRSAFLLALGFAWSAVIAAELLGQQQGLGRIVILAQFYGRTNILALVGAIVAVYAVASYLVVKRVLDYLTRWTESSGA